MQGSSGSGRADSGVIRKRGAPVLVELLKNATTAVPGVPINAPPASTRPARSSEPNLFSSASAQPAARAASGVAGVEAKPVITLQLRPAPAAESAGAETSPAAGGGGSRAALPPRFDRGLGGESGLGAWYRNLGVTGRSVLFAFAAVVVLAPIIWLVAFNRGESKASEKLGAALGGPGSSAGTGPMIVDPTLPPPQPRGAAGPGNSTPPAPARPQPPRPTPPSPGPGDAPAAVVTELVKGYNYLIAGTFKREKDADDTAAFLTKEGVPARVLTAKDMGAGGSGDHMVVITYGFAGASYSQTAKERNDLRLQIQKLGAKWKAENKLAPSDLSQPYFMKYN